MECFQCHKEMDEWDAILLNEDGDFVCSQACKDAHDREMEHFLNVTIHDDTLFAAWVTQDMCPETSKVARDIILGPE